MMAERGSRRSGYALAFLAGAVGGALATKGAPALLVKLQERCHRMMKRDVARPQASLGLPAHAVGP